MLQLYKGKSSKSYENVFFRTIARQLTQLFDQRNWDGMLIGMPACHVREDLQIDCLLVTAQQVIIIDFKKYNGTLQLPPEEQFSYGKWLLNNEIVVKGGSSPNPYSQLRKQRQKLSDQLRRRLPNFDKKTVSTIVCFHEKTEVMGRIPGKYQLDFSIADVTNYQQQIVDIIDVLEEKERNYLSERGQKVFLETLFDVALYSYNEHYELPEDEPVAVPLVADERYQKEIKDFLTSEQRIMILTGNTKSGKTSLIPSIRDQAFDCQFTDVPVFAYSNRIRRKMLKNNPHLEEVESLFGTIYDFGSETMDQFYKKTIPLQAIEELAPEERILYVIDDSQLITNSMLDTEQLQFGSGMLLNDILQHIDLQAHPNSKIIFIGDKNKLSYGSKVENALNRAYLASLLEEMDMYSDVYELALAEQKDYSSIVDTCNQIAKNIRQKSFSDLRVVSNDSIQICRKEQQRDLLERAFQSPDTSKIVVYSNADANQINRWIKKNLLRNGEELNVGDYVLFNATIEAYAPNEMPQLASPFDSAQTAFSYLEPKRIDHGLFGEVVQIMYAQQVVKEFEIQQEKVRLLFVPCHVKLADQSIVETYVLVNYLHSEKGELTTSELIAYHMVLDSYKQKLYDSEPFEQSREFAQMLASRNFVRLEEKGKMIYRQANDKRRLTPDEKSYRQRLEKKLLHPNSEYFKLLNAARVRYGWAMTVNKAMAYSFDHVFFNVNQDQRGRANLDYFKWLYTGISTASSEVQLINWEPITPFMKTEFQEKQAGISDWVLMKVTDDDRTIAEELKLFLEQQLEHVATVSAIASSNYLETVTLLLEGRALKLKFYYKNSGEVKLPQLNAGERSDYEHVLKLLQASTLSSLAQFEHLSILKGLAKRLKTQAIDMALPNYSDWKIILHFSNGEAACYVQLWYDSHGMITQFNLINGEQALYEEVVEVIKQLNDV